MALEPTTAYMQPFGNLYHCHEAIVHGAPRPARVMSAWRKADRARVMDRL